MIKSLIISLMLGGVVMLGLACGAPAQELPRTIHVFVALCDNQYQGIVPVPVRLGNGDDPENNLYWGALYGVKTVFRKSHSWKLLATVQDPRKGVLERCIFKHTRQQVFLVADAYKGQKIKQAVVEFLRAAAGRGPTTLSLEHVDIPMQGASDLVVYAGHNGLMDFRLWRYPRQKGSAHRDAIILACMSQSYFADALSKAGATPVLWTTGLMAPEAYTLESALEGWIADEDVTRIRLRAANAYHTYQKCGLQAAKRLFAVE